MIYILRCNECGTVTVLKELPSERTAFCEKCGKETTHAFEKVEKPQGGH